MAFKFLRSLDADDIFISYTRLDASTYAAGLADELTKLGFSCFIDKLGTDPNKDLPDTLRRKIRNCPMLVVVGTERAAGRETIEQEIREFLATGRTSIVPVNFKDAVYKARWYPLVEGIAPEPEPSPTALDDGDPSDSVVSRIKKQFNYRRRDERLRRITRRAVAVLVCLLVAIAVAAGVAWQQLARAAAATAKADAETARAAQAMKDARDALAQAQAAQGEAQRAKEEAGRQKDEAERQKAEAGKQKGLAERAAAVAEAKTKLADEATRRAEAAAERAKRAQGEAATQQTIAEARRLANHSQATLRQRPEEVQQSLDDALEAMKLSEGKKMHVLEADTALRESLSMMPRLRASDPYPSDAIVALSPDGRHFATLSGGKLSVYEYGVKAAPKVIDCDCASVALSGGGAYAAAQTGEGLKVFDLKGGAPPRLLKLGDGVSGDKMALSPDGRYIALYFGEGEDIDTHSVVGVYDAASGGLIKSFPDLQIFANDIAFGPTGNLAVAGRHTTQVGGKFAGRVALWALNPSDDAPAPELKADSFPAPEFIPLDSEVNAVAPGDSSSFATDRFVWTRTTGRVRYRPVGILGYSAEDKRNETETSVKRMAFSPDGGALTLVRGIRPVGDSGADEGDTLDVWDAAGREELSRVFHEKEVSSVGFKTARIVATMTGPPTEDEPARVFQADDGKEVEKIVYGPGEGDGDVKYMSPDGGLIVSVGEGSATVWDVWERKRQTAALGGALQEVEAVTLSPGGRFLALAGKGGGGWQFVVYSSDGGAYRELKRFSNPSDPVEMMSLSADGRRLAALHHYDVSHVSVWDTSTGSSVTPEALYFKREVETESFGSIPDMRLIALSPGGRFLMTTDRKNRTWLLDLSKGDAAALTPLPSLDGSAVTSVAFSRDDRYLGLGADDQYLHVFDTRGREGLTEIALLQHTGKVTAVAFSEDSKYVATASSDTHPYRVNEEESYPVRVWLLQPRDLIAEAESRQR
jgi:WD40 repeat protein